MRCSKWPPSTLTQSRALLIMFLTIDLTKSWSRLAQNSLITAINSALFLGFFSLISVSHNPQKLKSRGFKSGLHEGQFTWFDWCIYTGSSSLFPMPNSNVKESFKNSWKWFISGPNFLMQALLTAVGPFPLANSRTIKIYSSLENTILTKLRDF